MVYHGRIKNGQIELDHSVRLPEGAQVRVDVVANGDRSKESSFEGSVWERLLKIAGTAEGLPPDAARNHDVYLYGEPKRDA
jgi:hypothetical protein